MKKYKWIIILLNLVILIFIIGKSVLEKEEILEEGQLVLLKLAPVDPRSLMQGDYMTLTYEISRNSFNDTIPKRGYCVVTINSSGVAKKVRLQAYKTPITTGEYLINYTERHWNGINIGAESYFFQEGTGDRFEKAEYGGVKIDTDGNSLLIGLYDKDLKLIK